MISTGKKLLTLLITLIIISALSLCAFAGSEQELICISHRGDTAMYPENSLEGILSAFEKGADFVSVSVKKTSDGIYVLTENKKLSAVTDAPYEGVEEITYDELQKYYLYDNTGSITKYRMVSLSQTIGIRENIRLILDFDWQERDGIYDLIKHYNAFDRIYLRTHEPAKEITAWTSGKADKINVIGIYDGNIIFNAISHFDTLTQAQMGLMQFSSKNYFNVMYTDFFSQRFYSSPERAGVIAAMYDMDLSGQRPDSQEGWNEVLELGYNAIETNNIVALSSYKDRYIKTKNALTALFEKSKAVSLTDVSDVLAEGFTSAYEQAEQLIFTGVASLDELESTYSALLSAMNELNITSAESTGKGALNITAGKLIAVIAVGALILSAQVYVHKMQQEKKRNNAF